MWLVVVSSYETANFFEATKDNHGIEISHGLRYAAGNIMAYAVHVCVGPEKAKWPRTLKPTNICQHEHL
jgi:hypothetical protein